MQLKHEDMKVLSAGAFGSVSSIQFVTAANPLDSREVGNAFFHRKCVISGNVQDVVDFGLLEPRKDIIDNGFRHRPLQCVVILSLFLRQPFSPAGV